MLIINFYENNQLRHRMSSSILIVRIQEERDEIMEQKTGQKKEYLHLIFSALVLAQL